LKIRSNLVEELWLAKRISDIAKELGIMSKTIIDRCLAEGVAPEKIKGHMSTVSAGLEACIRDWFARPDDDDGASVRTKPPQPRGGPGEGARIA
jgi:hypothetical protein